MIRSLVGTIVTEGFDDENWPDSDEYVKSAHSVSMILNVDQPSQSIDVPHVRWGGECRSELRLAARIIGNGNIQIDGNAKLFEGDSESTTDLDDEESFSFIVPRTTASNPKPTHYRVQLVNEGSGDTATISMSFTNALLEQE